MRLICRLCGSEARLNCYKVIGNFSTTIELTGGYTPESNFFVETIECLSCGNCYELNPPVLAGSVDDPLKGSDLWAELLKRFPDLSKSFYLSD